MNELLRKAEHLGKWVSRAHKAEAKLAEIEFCESHPAHKEPCAACIRELEINGACDPNADLPIVVFYRDRLEVAEAKVKRVSALIDSIDVDYLTTQGVVEMFEQAIAD